MQVRSYSPISGRNPRAMILGTAPSLASLAAREYYAHPRNRFWPMMGELVGAGRHLTYAARKRRLAASGIALWDVLKACERPGSLDGSIRRHTEVPNDVAGFLRRHPSIRVIFLNGATAEVLFRRHHLRAVQALRPDLRIIRLPSTSPANATWSPARKLRAWRQVLRFL